MPAHTVREYAARSEALQLELVADAGHFIVDENPSLSRTERFGSSAAGLSVRRPPS